jgi:hypothetical protein
VIFSTIGQDTWCSFQDISGHFQILNNFSSCLRSTSSHYFRAEGNDISFLRLADQVLTGRPSMPVRDMGG